ncbi:hypothetical protein LWI28_001461 [Acer negundo]|uniref:Uncharacterized protein n=1 Tax=Acer negundo TaxID=4023 RepID=A0AAD5ICD0_ACENE|nr:hypothetical protein LWI28_001461 [Acer negundo]KAK4840029.1 hypothetical protein QYF36_026769 [Acer negundo]
MAEVPFPFLLSVSICCNRDSMQMVWIHRPIVFESLYLPRRHYSDDVPGHVTPTVCRSSPDDDVPVHVLALC